MHLRFFLLAAALLVGAVLADTRRQVQFNEDTSHWCCKGGISLPSIQKTKLEVVLTVVQTKHITGYQECGVFGMGVCPLYEVAYKHVPVYHVTQYEVPDLQHCPAGYLTCCQGFIQLGTTGDCIALSTLTDSKDLILSLHNLGLLWG